MNVATCIGLSVCLWLLSCVTVLVDSDTAIWRQGLVYETEDAVVVEAAWELDEHADNELRERNRRHVVYEPLVRQFGGWPGVLPVGPCFTSKGVFGHCTSFRKCYPYFKLPELSNWETWILGMYDTCSYFSASGRQMFGVCCSNPGNPRPPEYAPPEEPAPIGPPATTTTVKTPPHNPNNPIPPNWPPPLPTHPPDHTIPPLPTHPPSPGWPGLNPGTTPSPPRPPPTMPPTSRPPVPVWPPAMITHPPPKPPPTAQPQPPSWPPAIITHPPPKPPPTAQPQPPSWPPAIITHPPPVAPPTVQPPAWPPAIITHPPAKPPPANPWPPAPPPGHPPTHPPMTTPAPDIGGGASCGAKNGFQDQERIVGGQNADLGEWPWIAALFNGGRQFCGGSLIDTTHILTAAHCVAHMSSWDVARLSVKLGDHNIKTNTEVHHIEKKVARVVRHRGFDSRTLYNDVAILTLDSPVTYSKQVKPICLPSGSALYNGQTATVIGWGSLREGGPPPAILQEVNIPIWTNAECKAKYGNAAPGGIVEHFLCAGQAGRDSCSGDSGGPLTINTGRWTQVGIVSWGIGCGKGQYPGVYTRVTHFMPWITKNLK